MEHEAILESAFAIGVGASEPGSSEEAGLPDAVAAKPGPVWDAGERGLKAPHVKLSVAPVAKKHGRGILRRVAREASLFAQFRHWHSVGAHHPVVHESLEDGLEKSACVVDDGPRSIEGAGVVEHETYVFDEFPHPAHGRGRWAVVGAAEKLGANVGKSHWAENGLVVLRQHVRINRLQEDVGALVAHESFKDVEAPADRVRQGVQPLHRHSLLSSRRFVVGLVVIRLVVFVALLCDEEPAPAHGALHVGQARLLALCGQGLQGLGGELRRRRWPQAALVHALARVLRAVKWLKTACGSEVVKKDSHGSLGALKVLVGRSVHCKGLLEALGHRRVLGSLDGTLHETTNFSAVACAHAGRPPREVSPVCLGKGVASGGRHGDAKRGGNLVRRYPWHRGCAGAGGGGCQPARKPLFHELQEATLGLRGLEQLHGAPAQELWDRPGVVADVLEGRSQQHISSEVWPGRPVHGNQIRELGVASLAKTLVHQSGNQRPDEGDGHFMEQPGFQVCGATAEHALVQFVEGRHAAHGKGISESCEEVPHPHQSCHVAVLKLEHWRRSHGQRRT
mmetsp:Transcript_31289/g.90985  ORF Transcript_31289/g.90985 Transcript_31289/m.90985 type:complete len:565 (-) Transcript_31289:1734-3428(-)